MTRSKPTRKYFVISQMWPDRAIRTAIGEVLQWHVYLLCADRSVEWTRLDSPCVSCNARLNLLEVQFRYFG